MRGVWWEGEIEGRMVLGIGEVGCMDMGGE